MEEAKNQSKAVIIVIAIIALLLINGSIYYTSLLTKQSEDLSSDVVESVSTSKLDTTNMALVTGRLHIDVSAQLTPNTSGRENPFVGQ
ncbi:MAG: hypothetical protein WC773_03940 [Patescibacteria group bacterium]|jgi:hypothetical protein